jgi:hypothetical protein
VVDLYYDAKASISLNRRNYRDYDGLSGRYCKSGMIAAIIITLVSMVCH